MKNENVSEKNKIRKRNTNTEKVSNLRIIYGHLNDKKAPNSTLSHQECDQKYSSMKFWYNWIKISEKKK